MTGDHAVKDERDDLPIFIHRELDDYGLDPYEFRVYARLARRADGKDGAYESIANMAKACGMGTTRVRQCLRDLEVMQLIVRSDRAGETTVYRLTSKGTWRKTPTPRVAPTGDVAPTPRVEVPQRQTLGTPTPDVAKGTPTKVHQEKVKEPTRAKPKKGHEFNPAVVAEELPENFDRELFVDFCARRLEVGAPMTLLALKQFVSKHKRTPADELDEMFRAAIIAGWKDLYSRDSKPAKPPPKGLDQYTERGL
jgi:hypothetical protein